MSRWFSGAKRERGESSGSGRHRGQGAPTPAPPAAFAGNLPRRVQVIRPAAPAPTATQAPAAPGARRTRRRRYVPEPEVQWHWDNATPVPWPDVHLPDGVHLNPQRIPVPAVPSTARARAAEIDRRRRLLTPEQRADPAYSPNSSNWDRWFHEEHEERRYTYYAAAPSAPAPGAYPQLPEGTEALWFEEEVEDHDDDPELAEAVERSRRSLVEDEIKRWEQVLRENLPPPPPLPMPPPREEFVPWYVYLERELEQDRIAQGLPPPPPLPPGLVGQRWQWTGPANPPGLLQPQDAVWDQQEQEQQEQEAEEDAPPPDEHPGLSPHHQPPPDDDGAPPAHLWTAPPYVVIDP